VSNNGIVTQENGSEDASALMTLDNDGSLLFAPTMEPFFPIPLDWLLCYDESPWEAAPHSAQVAAQASSAGLDIGFRNIRHWHYLPSDAHRFRHTAAASVCAKQAIVECVKIPELKAAAEIIAVTAANQPGLTNGTLFALHNEQWAKVARAPAMLSMDGATPHLNRRAVAALTSCGVYPAVESQRTRQTRAKPMTWVPNACLKRAYKEGYSQFQLFDAAGAGGRMSDAQRVRLTVKAVAPIQWRVHKSGSAAWERIGWSKDGFLDVVKAFPVRHCCHTGSGYRVARTCRSSRKPYLNSLFSWENLSRRPGSPHVVAYVPPAPRNAALPSLLQ
jgi:hypothetical protein